MTAIAVQPLSTVHGATQFSSATRQDHLAELRDLENARALLDQKICEPLKLLGYNITKTSRVSQLVKQNTITATLAPQNLKTSHSIGSIVEQELLSSSLKINSNEPVCLIELPTGQLDVGEVCSLKDDLLESLRQHGVKPVRVYVKLLKDGTDGGKVALLNVVNTELGGPSMVQLLDRSFHNESWKEILVLKEAWNGYDLMWRDEAWPQSASADGSGTTEMFKPEENTSLQHSAADAPMQEPKAVSEASSHSESPVIEPSTKEVVHDEPILTEHPAMKALREREESRAHVQYPTFTRGEDNEGLLDIIRTHSSGIETRGPAAVIQNSSKEIDDEFEVI